MKTSSRLKFLDRLSDGVDLLRNGYRYRSGLADAGVVPFLNRSRACGERLPLTARHLWLIG
jgi:hypothetical protein